MAKKQGPAEAQDDLEHQDSDGKAPTQVLSTRVPVAFAKEVAAQAAALGVRPADLVRQAVEAYLRNPGVVGLRANSEGSFRLVSDAVGYATQNVNPVVQPAEIIADPPDVVALGL